MKHNIDYYMHTLLNSKYKLFINLFIISFIYILFYGNSIVFCMTEDITLPEIAEAKPSKHIRTRTHLEQLIHREISSYLETAQIIEDQKQAMVSLEAENKILKTYLRDTAKNCMKYYYQQMIDRGAGGFEHEPRNSTFFKDDFTMIDEMVKEDNKHLKYRPPVDEENPYYIGRNHGISLEEGDY